MGPIENNGDQGPGSRRAIVGHWVERGVEAWADTSVPHPIHWQLDWGAKPKARKQNRVGNESKHLNEVGWTARHQIPVSFRDDTAGYRRQTGQVGIGRRFAPNRYERYASGDTALSKLGELVLPRHDPAKQTNDDERYPIDGGSFFEPGWVQPTNLAKGFG